MKAAARTNAVNRRNLEGGSTVPLRTKQQAAAYVQSDRFKTFGPPELRTWRNGSGVCRFQTTSPRFARKLSQRSRARLVAWSVNKGYLRIFEEPMQPWRAQRLVTRYLTATNGGFSESVGQSQPLKTAERVDGCGSTKGRLKATKGVFSDDPL